MRFRSLAVVVVDEQHRFGVRQRSALDEQGARGARAARAAHDGDADPAHARAVRVRRPRPDAPARAARAGGVRSRRTSIAGERERARAYERIARGGARRTPGVRRLPAGRCRRATGVESARAARPRSSSACARASCATCALVLLHGQLGHREKQAAMAAFAAGDADVLIATTVIEVGIDVPNATVMLIENAERFGISQLHQLRGRVGRGERASLCLLCGPKGSARLAALAAHDDGFELAEIDLRLRQEGELVGTKPVRRRAASPSRALPGRRGRCWRSRARRGRVDDRRGPAARGARARAARRARSSARTARSPRTRSPREPMRVIAGELGGRRICRAARRRDAADLRARPRGALLDARRAARAARARSLRRLGRAGDRGALARRGARDLRRTRGAGARGAARESRLRWAWRSVRGFVRAMRSPHCAATETYDLVFLDPPYAMAEALADQLSRALPGRAGRGGARRQRVRPARAARRSHCRWRASAATATP